MPATQHQRSFGRSLMNLRRDSIHSVTTTNNNNGGGGGGGNELTQMESELDSFQRLVAESFSDLNASPHESLLSLEWVVKLLDSFSSCQEEFRAIVFNHRSLFAKPPLDRIIGDYFDRSVKALDVCNAIRDGVEQIRQWQKLIEIVLSAFNNNNGGISRGDGGISRGDGGGGSNKPLGEGQFRRAKRTLIELAISMLEGKDSSSSSSQHRNRSFGRNHHHRSHQNLNKNRPTGHFRSLSWSVSRSWSASKQLQAIGNNITTPRAGDVTSTNGLVVPVYTMTCVLLFVMWALVAAIPCQDRGLQVHFNVPTRGHYYQWGKSLMSLHDKIVEESNKRERKNSCGLLREIEKIEKCSRSMSEVAENVSVFPLSQEKEIEVKEMVFELVKVKEDLEIGLDLFERKVREVFHRIVRSRTEVLDSFGKNNP
ncbi:unnamed protein product [Cochlearia groenlandica]